MSIIFGSPTGEADCALFSGQQPDISYVLQGERRVSLVSRIIWFMREEGPVVTMVLEESSTFVAYLHKQIPFGSFLDDVRKQPPMTP